VLLIILPPENEEIAIKKDYKLQKLIISLNAVRETNIQFNRL